MSNIVVKKIPEGDEEIKSKVKSNKMPKFLMIPIQTATCSFNYDIIFYSYSLDKLVELTHKELSRQLNWKYYPLKKGSFGFDSIAESIGQLLYQTKIKCIEEGAMFVHNAWAYNYKWWRDIKPWISLDKLYYKPTKSLGDKRRNDLSISPYTTLSEKNKKTNRIIAKYLLVDLLGILIFRD
jgi:glycerophosphoryl diester phosphodiesterase